FGMDHMDWLGWLYVGGGLQMWRDFYQNDLKLNVIVWPAHPSSPQALGWFKKPLKSVADFKGMKCRQTGLNAEVYAKLGQSVVNMAGGEIIPAAQRGVIDCAEWVGGIEDLRLGLHQVYKYHYTPGLHENNTIGELTFNLDVWKSLSAMQQEQVRSALRDAFLSWIARNQKENADALKEFREKHGVQVLRTPPEILLAYLKAWDDMAAEESARNPFFRNMKLERDDAGASFADILKVTVYLLDVNDRSKINPVRKEFFGAARPTSTLIGVSELAIPGMKVEIEAVVGLRK